MASASRLDALVEWNSLHLHNRATSWANGPETASETDSESETEACCGRRLITSIWGSFPDTGRSTVAPLAPLSATLQLCLSALRVICCPQLRKIYALNAARLHRFSPATRGSSSLTGNLLQDCLPAPTPGMTGNRWGLLEVWNCR